MTSYSVNEYNLFEAEAKGKHVFDNELIAICENIQKDLLLLIEKMEFCIFAVIDDNYTAFEIREQFHKDISMFMYKIDEDIQVIRDKVRVSIDSCNLKDDRLNFLLTIHKYQQAVGVIVKELSENINDSIEKTLEMKIGGIINATIEKNIIIKMAHLRKEISKPIMSFGPRTRKFI